MKYLNFVAALLSLSASVYAHAGHDESPAAEAAEAGPTKVVQLKTDNFETYVKEHPLALVKFYAPWCGHCKALAPEYEKAANTLAEQGKDGTIVKVDCTEEADLCQKYEVQGYPTVKLFKGPENPVAYPGGRNADAIVSFMVKQSLPAVSVLDAEKIEAFKTQDKVVVVAYLSEDDKANTELINTVADAHRLDYLFGSTTDAALAAAEGVKAPAVVVYRSFDEPKVVYDGELKNEDLVKFIKTAATPLIGEVGPETYQGYMSAGIPLAYLFVEKDAANRAELIEAIAPIAKELKGKINFATIDATAYGAHAPNLNLEQKWPAFAIQETVKNAKYPFSQEKEITKDAIESFVRDFVAGNVAPSVKSEDIPTENDGPVRVVVAKSYQEEVIDNEKDVLLEIYAPWCGHCKALAPKYEELAGLYANNPEFKDKVVVAKVDATVNDLPLDVQGFPTIKLFPAGSKDAPVDYAGSRTIEDLANFIRDNGKFKVDAYVAPHAESESPAAAEEAPKAAESAAEEKKEEAHDEL